MKLESIEKLRKVAATQLVDGQFLIERHSVEAAADAIEREVAELQRNYEFLQRAYDAAVADRNANWMKLPVDADGEPIRVGDELKCQCEDVSLNSLVWDGKGWYATEMIVSSGWYPAHICRHRKPTVEDVLVEFWYENVDGVRTPTTDAFKKWADKLREAVRSDG